jgi:hypothetical protein
MSKKSKRQVSKGRVRVVAVPPSTVSTSQTGGEMPVDYSYVVRDLKRIGTLAGGIFLVMIVLSFFLR